MKNGLFRFYVFFMVMSVALFSCENHQVSHDTTENIQNSHRKPESEGRQPVEPNDISGQQKEKKSPRKYTARSSNWC